jgi:uncharacterized membrane protein
MARKTSTKKASSVSTHGAQKLQDDDKLFALLGVAIPLVGYIILLLAKKNTPYVSFYGKQGVILFMAWVVASVFGWFFSLVPVVGEMIGMMVWAIVLILWIVSLVNALSGEARDTPLIGVYAGRL